MAIALKSDAGGNSGTIQVNGVDMMSFSPNSGGTTNITGIVSATLFNSLSDINLKKDINTISDAVDTVKQLNGVEYRWKSNENKSYGVIAQEIEKILPDIVSTNEDGVKTVNHTALFGFLIEAIKELSAEIDSLKRK